MRIGLGLGINQARMRPQGLAGGGGEVTVEAASDVTYVTSTQVSRTIPATTEEGDVILACLFHRTSESGITAPSGFTRIAQVESAHPQWTEVWTKTAGASDADTSITFTGSSSARLGLILLVVKGSPTLEDSASATFETDGAVHDHVFPSVTSGGGGRLWLVLASCAFGGDMTLSEGFTQYTPTSIGDNRLCVGAQSVGEGATGTATVSHAIASHSAGMLSLILAPES